MKKLVIAICASAFTLGSAVTLAADMMDPFSQMLMKPMTPAETAQAKSERDAGKAKWATMTPEQKAAVRTSMRDKKLADLNAMELVAQANDMTAMTASETAQAKAERDAARAKYAKMTPEEKTAMRKAARQKKLGELNVTEQVGQENDLNRYMSY
jgi:hypothetical protein